MFHVVFHDYMKDMLEDEFIFASGKTEEEAASNAWNKLKSNIDSSLIKEFHFDDDRKVTRKLFIKELIENRTSSDALFISRPYYLYAKLFKTSD